MPRLHSCRLFAQALAIAVFFLAHFMPCQVNLAQGATVAAQEMVSPRGNVTPLMPFLEYCIDDGILWDIEEAASSSRSNAYKPLNLESLPREEGIVWLRFVLAPALSQHPASYLLDIGSSVPGVPVLYTPQRNELSGAMEWTENLPAERNLLLLPEVGSEPIPCYIRLDGFPGPWFAPMIRSPQNAAGNWGSLSRTGAILALGVVMLLCLLRGMSENGQWRIWTALYVGVALLQASLGMPAIRDGFNFADLVATLTPGLALMLLPHVGRHLMRTPQKSRAIDIQLALLSLPGAVLALLPLIPGFIWLDRWLELWPILTILFVPTAIGAWIMGLGGSRRFLSGSLIPPMFVTFAIFGMEFGIPANLLASAPEWGVALSALLIAATRAPLESTTQKNKPEQTIISPPMEKGALDNIINLGHPLDDPNLRLLPNDGISTPEALENAEGKQNNSELREDKPAHLPEKRELALRGAVDEILRETGALGNCSLPAAAREYAEKIIASGEKMAEILSLPSLEPEPVPSFQDKLENFNLQRILRESHDYIVPAAEHAGLSLSWHMPPHLEQEYQGDARGLAEVLKMLLESAIRGTERGSVHLSARRMPDSTVAEHILFTITDSGNGFPPLKRSSVALAKAWEYAAKYGGYLNMETGIHGSTISFSAHFAPVESNATIAETEPNLILASEDENERNRLAKLAQNVGCKVNIAKTMREVLVCQRLNPASLLIAEGRFAHPAAADMVREFAELAQKAGYAKWHILAITPDDSEWPLLKPSGFTHAMIAPVDADAFSTTIRELLNASLKKDNLSDEDKEVRNSPKSGTSLIDLMDEFYQHTGGFEQAQKDEASEVNPTNSESPAPMAPFEGPDWLFNEKNEPGANEQADNTEKPEVEMPADKAREDNPESAEVVAPAKSDHANDSIPTSQKLNETKILPPVVEDPASPASQPDQDSTSPHDSANINRQDPIIVALVHNLDSAMAAAVKAAAAGDTRQVAEAAGRIAQQAESFHLRVLTRIAQTVERAASAPDLEAVRDILPELVNAVERNSITLTQRSVYKSNTGFQEK